MTKKFIHTDKEINGMSSINEFLIPDIFSNSIKFIGLSSGKSYDRGLIVYTGKQITPSELLDKSKNIKPLNIFKKRQAKKKLENYLHQITKIKVGSIVKLNTELEIEQTNNKEIY